MRAYNSLPLPASSHVLQSSQVPLPFPIRLSSPTTTLRDEPGWSWTTARRPHRGHGGATPAPQLHEHPPYIRAQGLLCKIVVWYRRRSYYITRITSASTMPRFTSCGNSNLPLQIWCFPSIGSERRFLGVIIRLLVDCGPVVCGDRADGYLVVPGEDSVAGPHRRDGEALAWPESVSPHPVDS